MINFNSTELGKLDSMTKYPSIPTYHTIDNRGILQDEYIDFSGDKLVIKEKIDGTNARLLIFPDGDYVIGARDNLIVARGDRIPNPALSIAEAVIPVADRIVTEHADELNDVLTVFYGEVYGRNVSKNSKQYGSSALGFRVFDVMIIDEDKFVDVASMPREHISLWRQHGNQPFADEDTLQNMCNYYDIALAPRTYGTPLPTGIAETHAWLVKNMPQSMCTLTDDALGRAEGVVIRTPDRSKIAKIRFEDYEKTLHQRK